MNDFTYYNDEWNPPIEGTSQPAPITGEGRFPQLPPEQLPPAPSPIPQ